MRKLIIAAVAASAAAAAPASAATFEWVTGKVSGFTSQLPNYTVAIVGGKSVRFCDPSTGAPYDPTAGNVRYDLLSLALQTQKSIQVGVQNFGLDPATGSNKLCIDRVVY